MGPAGSGPPGRRGQGGARRIRKFNKIIYGFSKEGLEFNKVAYDFSKEGSNINKKSHNSRWAG